MSYISGSLMDGEEIIYETRPHGIKLFRPIAIVASGVALAFLAYNSSYPALAKWLFPLGFIFSVPSFLDFISAEFGVTNRRLFIKFGWLRIQTLEAPLSRVGAVAVDQGICGRLLDYGTLIVKGPGGMNETLEKIRAPFDFRQIIHEQLFTVPDLVALGDRRKAVRP